MRKRTNCGRNEFATEFYQIVVLTLSQWTHFMSRGIHQWHSGIG
jgi:hypothetical protein